MQQRKNNIPTYYHNEFAQTSQNNFQNQQKQQQTVSPQLISNMNPFNVNQPGSSFQHQPFQQYQTTDCIGGQQVPSQNLISNPYQQNPNMCSSTPGMQNQNYFGSLTQGLLDQFRSCINSAAPIFILPNACPNPAPTTPQLPNSILGHNMGYPVNYPPMGVPYTSPPVCIPYALPIPIYNNITNQDRRKEKSNNCECCPKMEMMRETFKNPNIFNEFTEHKCKESREENTICTKKHCPSSLNLQALASQFLAIPGIISCASTRLILRKVPGSNIITNVDETINTAVMAINQLNKDQLLTESKNAQQINALINIHMNANPPSIIIPILTMIQLKVNLLKAHVEHLINKKLMENQGIGAEGSGNLDPLVLTLKTDAELREFLAALREKECQERVNFNFAPYHAQRLLSESHLNNIQSKISQVEDEMNRRRNSSIPRTSIVNRLQCQITNPCYYNNSLLSAAENYPTQTYESPDPFIIQVRNPKRLNLKPHVGSPETTYEQSKDSVKDNENVCCNVSKENLENNNRSSTSSDHSPENNFKDEKISTEKSNENNQLINCKDNDNKEIKSIGNAVDVCNNNDNDVKKTSNQNDIENSEIDNIPSKEFSQKCYQEHKIDLETENLEEKNTNDLMNKTRGKNQPEENNCKEIKTLVSEDLENENKLASDDTDHQRANEDDLDEDSVMADV
ncbi:putative mediator of RNA polymerase II transcription subunit 24 [Leptopilina boulardi]|uniref:putative mediator of RNA polymerase II transcription subunit 24 n=1 Tax=Leptopilina boulardi TaxID=63433 RepID=UPI0021F5A55D|nr:putative mediator of RNA polymerase II transcription subunit 24 [Leptopilina boulardi]